MGTRRSQELESEHAIENGSMDFVFIDHDKSAYLPDLKLILRTRAGCIRAAMVVADNMQTAGSTRLPRVHAETEEGRSWCTNEHETHVEYQSLLKDLVLESDYLGH